LMEKNTKKPNSKNSAEPTSIIVLVLYFICIFTNPNAELIA
jgi:hypothetical protein